MSRTVQEPLRDLIGRALYEEGAPSPERDWYRLSEERREPWRKDSDRVIQVIWPHTAPKSVTNILCDALKEVMAYTHGDADHDKKTINAICKTAMRKHDAAQATTKDALMEIQAAVAQQAEDEGLWFTAVTASEAYLQQELRKLHAIIESA